MSHCPERAEGGGGHIISGVDSAGNGGQGVQSGPPTPLALLYSAVLHCTGRAGHPASGGEEDGVHTLRTPQHMADMLQVSDLHHIDMSIERYPGSVWCHRCSQRIGCQSCVGAAIWWQVAWLPLGPGVLQATTSILRLVTLVTEQRGQ